MGIQVRSFAASPVLTPALILRFSGGPGLSGVNWLSAHASEFQATVGRDWDVLSFDPREFRLTARPSLIYARLSCNAGGVGLSGPVLKQFASMYEEATFWQSVMKAGAFEAHGNLTMSKDVGFL